jgi:hypothetical protein
MTISPNRRKTVVSALAAVAIASSLVTAGVAHASTRPTVAGKTCKVTAWKAYQPFLGDYYSAATFIDETGDYTEWVRVRSLGGETYSRTGSTCATQYSDSYDFEARDEACASPSYHEGCTWDSGWSGTVDGLKSDAVHIGLKATPHAFVENYYEGYSEEVAVPSYSGSTWPL